MGLLEAADLQTKDDSLGDKRMEAWANLSDSALHGGFL